jgi:uncharacterized protein (TIGR03382 family)
MKVCVSIGAAAIAAGVASADVYTVEMDRQINNGDGDAIYVLGDGALTFETDGVDGWARNTMPGNNWYYLYTDFELAGLGPLDLTQGGTIEFDVRYFQDPDTNGDPYADAPVFAKIYTYDDDGNYLGSRDYGIVYATQNGDDPYPTWTHVTIDIDDPDATDDGLLDLADITKIRWYGTDWQGTGDDFVDVRNLVITTIPGPGSLALIALGAAVIRRRR